MDRRQRSDDEYFIGMSTTRSYSQRYSTSRTSRKRRKQKLYIRRALIVAVCVLLLAAIITLGWLIISGIAKLFSGGGKPEETQPATTVSTQPATLPADQVFNLPKIEDTGEDGDMLTDTLYLYNREAYNLFHGTEQSAKYYAETLNKMSKELGEGLTVYSMVVPNHTEFGLPQRIIDSGVASSSQAENLKFVHQYTDSSIKDINCYNKLSEHVDDYIYFHTDHHWTGLGAYYAYTAFCEQTGQTPYDFTSGEKNTIPGFTGSFYTMTNSVTLAENADVVEYFPLPNNTWAMLKQHNYSEPMEVPVYYEFAESGSMTYGVFCWGDTAEFVINSDAGTGKKILMFKDSYGNAFAPYLTANYDEIHVIDYRYWEGDIKEYISSNGITEVLFLNNVMAANTISQIDTMASIITTE